MHCDTIVGDDRLEEARLYRDFPSAYIRETWSDLPAFAIMSRFIRRKENVLG